MCVRLPGWTLDDVLDQITPPVLDRLNSAWKSCPPAAELAARQAGIKPREQPTKNFHELLGMFPGGVIR